MKRDFAGGLTDEFSVQRVAVAEHENVGIRRRRLDLSRADSYTGKGRDEESRDESARQNTSEHYDGEGHCVECLSLGCDQGPGDRQVTSFSMVKQFDADRESGFRPGWIYGVVRGMIWNESRNRPVSGYGLSDVNATNSW